MMNGKKMMMTKAPAGKKAAPFKPCPTCSMPAKCKAAGRCMAKGR